VQITTEHATGDKSAKSLAFPLLRSLDFADHHDAFSQRGVKPRSKAVNPPRDPPAPPLHVFLRFTSRRAVAEIFDVVPMSGQKPGKGCWRIVRNVLRMNSFASGQERAHELVRTMSADCSQNQP
jgi:hypothetical protein